MRRISKVPGVAALAWTAVLASEPALAQEVVRVPTDASFSVQAADLPDCRDSERLHLTFGGRPIAPPRAAVEAIMPYQLRVTGDVNDPEDMWMELPAGAGCEGAPLEAGVAVVPAALSGLSVDISLAAQTGGPFTQMARLRDSGQCTPLDGGRVGCAGSTDAGGQAVRVTAVIASDPTALTSDGLPLFVICQEADGQMFCEASGVRSGIGFKTLSWGSGLPSVEEIRTVYEAVDSAFEAWAD